MSHYRRMIDVELTNRCNALCSFCPRAATPDQGFMTFDVFKQTVARVKELQQTPRLALTGQGEQLLHPEIIEFVRYATDEGVDVRMTTNANLLDKETSRQLLEAGLKGVAFSVSDMGEDYELVYNLNFEKTHTNIVDFMGLRESYPENSIGVSVSIVIHDLNKGKIDEMKKYWTDLGIGYAFEFEQNNRGGACDNAHYFIGNDQYDTEARDLLMERGGSSLCAAPFFFVFIGWSGQYYICCSDYKKETPLGTVFEHSIESMDSIKLEAMKGYMPACSVCNIEPVNAVREKMFELEHGEAETADLEKVVDYQVNVNNPRLPPDIDILQWQESVLPS